MSTLVVLKLTPIVVLKALSAAVARVISALMVEFTIVDMLELIVLTSRFRDDATSSTADLTVDAVEM
jgi:hypothetical protein